MAFNMGATRALWGEWKDGCGGGSGGMGVVGEWRDGCGGGVEEWVWWGKWRNGCGGGSGKMGVVGWGERMDGR